ncbi:protein of unknown function [Methylorubrum extorquens]|uniref:Uncharacterized protein n=1 Tax=Methylorubrum extorquens TaxID=408 RepID=A0A2N9AXG0_METEX|nr:protein of unknown function [Methylorubrum extorquens]
MISTSVKEKSMSWSVEILDDKSDDIEYYIAVGGEREARTNANEQKSLGRIILAIKNHAGNLVLDRYYLLPASRRPVSERAYPRKK